MSFPSLIHRGTILTLNVIPFCCQGVCVYVHTQEGLQNLAAEGGSAASFFAYIFPYLAIF